MKKSDRSLSLSKGTIAEGSERRSVHCCALSSALPKAGRLNGEDGMLVAVGGRAKERMGARDFSAKRCKRDRL